MSRVPSVQAPPPPALTFHPLASSLSLSPFLPTSPILTGARCVAEFQGHYRIVRVLNRGVGEVVPTGGAVSGNWWQFVAVGMAVEEVVTVGSSSGSQFAAIGVVADWLKGVGDNVRACCAPQF